MNLKKYPIVLFDSECTMCARFAFGIQKLDKNNIINCISAHNEKVYESLPYLTKEECLSTLHVIKSKDEYVRGEDAIEYLIGIVPGIKNISWLMKSDSAQSAVKFFYNRFNKARSALKTCPSCQKGK